MSIHSTSNWAVYVHDFYQFCSVLLLDVKDDAYVYMTYVFIGVIVLAALAVFFSCCFGACADASVFELLMECMFEYVFEYLFFGILAIPIVRLFLLTINCDDGHLI